MKELNIGQRRFEIRKQSNTKLFRVYDIADGCYPYQTPELGKVVQDVKEAEAQAEANRLNELFVREAPLIKKQERKVRPAMSGPAPVVPAKKKSTSVSSPVETVEPVIEKAPVKELADYGVMTPEERAKYEDGLLEAVAY